MNYFLAYMQYKQFCHESNMTQFMRTYAEYVDDIKFIEALNELDCE